MSAPAKVHKSAERTTRATRYASANTTVVDVVNIGHKAKAIMKDAGDKSETPLDESTGNKRKAQSTNNDVAHTSGKRQRKDVAPVLRLPLEEITNDVADDREARRMAFLQKALADFDAAQTAAESSSRPVPTPVVNKTSTAPTKNILVKRNQPDVFTDMPEGKLRAQGDPKVKIEVLHKPKGEAGNAKNGFNMQTAIELDDEDYDEFLDHVRAAVISCRVDKNRQFREQDPEAVSNVCRKVSQDLPYFTKLRFPGHWAIREALKHTLRNSRKHKKRKAVLKKSPETSPNVWRTRQPIYISDGEGNHHVQGESDENDSAADE